MVAISQTIASVEPLNRSTCSFGRFYLKCYASGSGACRSSVSSYTPSCTKGLRSMSCSLGYWSDELVSVVRSGSHYT